MAVRLFLLSSFDFLIRVAPASPVADKAQNIDKILCKEVDAIVKVLKPEQTIAFWSSFLGITTSAITYLTLTTVVVPTTTDILTSVDVLPTTELMQGARLLQGQDHL